MCSNCGTAKRWSDRFNQCGPYNWRLLGDSATDSVAAPTTGFVTSVSNADFSVPMNTAADGTQLTGSVDGMQGFQLTVDYN